MRILITGGNGFIGRYVAEDVRAAGHEAIILDRMDRREEYRESPAFFGDVRDPNDVTEAMAHADAFIHLAAVLGTQETIGNPAPSVETNILGSLNVLEAAAQYRVPGSYIGVGNHWMNNSYSISKTCVERFINMYNTERGTQVNVVRAMNAYGPGQEAAPPYGSSKVRKITPSFVCRALHGDPIEVYGDGLQVSDMVYVADVATALVNAALKASYGVVFDCAVEVGPKQHNTVLDVAMLVKDLTETASEIVHLPMRPGEIANSTVMADVETLQLVDMDHNDLLPLEDGLRRTIDWFKCARSSLALVPA